MEQAEIISILNRYPAALRNKKLLTGLLHDFFPTERGAVKVLMDAFDMGIVEEISANPLDEFLKNRFCRRLADECGISDAMAKWAVTTWIVCYGRDILQKDLLININRPEQITYKKEASAEIEQMRNESDSITLTAMQLRAVRSEARQTLVVAGPGSGKTRVLTERICYLIQEKNVPSKDIVALTFTAKAANEMRHRLQERLLNQSVQIKTFHSLGLQILRSFPQEVGRTDDFEIVDRTRKNALVRDILQEKNIRRDQIDLYTTAISNIKNALLPVDTDSPFRIQEVLAAYNQQLLINDMIDLDDMVTLAVQLLENNKMVRDVYSIRFPYILVDEFQDVNPLQLRMLDALTVPETYQFLVGDDDQCIYEWRGSKPGTLVDMAKNTSGTELIRLEENFRSESNIVQLSDFFISHNKNRIFKKLLPAKKKTLHGLPATESSKYKRFSNAESQANFIAQEILALCENQKYKPGDFAILLRSKKQQEGPITEALTQAGIAFYDSSPDSFRYDGFTKVLAAVEEPNKKNRLLQALNYPTVSLDDVVMQEIYSNYPSTKDCSIPVMLQTLCKQNAPFEDSSIIYGRFNLIQELHDQKDSLSAIEIMERLLAYYQTEPMATRKSVMMKLEDINSLLQFMQEYASANGNALGLTEGLDYIQLALQDERNSEKSETAVNILTCHKAKGLEFPVVFIPDVQVGVFPNDFFVHTEEQLEEERRLFYVTMTRAMELLYVTCSADPLAGSQKSSVISHGFLAEIPNIVIS